MITCAFLPLDHIRPPVGRPHRSSNERLVVRPERGIGYVIVAGHGRYLAAARSRQRYVHCLLREDGGETAVERLAEHVMVGGLDPIEEAKAIREIMRDGDLSQRDMERTYGVPQSHVSKRLALLQLPVLYQERVTQRLMTIDEALHMVREVT